MAYSKSLNPRANARFISALQGKRFQEGRRLTHVPGRVAILAAGLGILPNSSLKCAASCGGQHSKGQVFYFRTLQRKRFQGGRRLIHVAGRVAILAAVLGILPNSPLKFPAGAIN